MDLFLNDSMEKLIEKDLEVIKILERASVKTFYVPVSGIGDGLMFSAVAKALFEQNGGKEIFCSHKNKALFENNPYIKTIDGLEDGKWTPQREAFFKNNGIEIVYPTYWKFFYNVEGRLVFGFPQKHAILAMAEKAGVCGKIALKPEIYLTEQEKKFGRLFEENQIAIMSSALDEYKQWPHWQELVDILGEKFSFVQLGAKEDVLLKGALDMRGKLSLRECASVLYNSDLFVGQIGGLMHLARAVNCPAVIAYSGAEPLEFVSYSCNENLLPEDPCECCSKNIQNPIADYCSFDRKCIKTVPLGKMIAAVEKKMEEVCQYKSRERELLYDCVPVNSIEKNGLFEYYLRNGTGVFCDGVKSLKLKRKKKVGLRFFETETKTLDKIEKIVSLQLSKKTDYYEKH